MLVPKLRFKREDGTDYPEWEEKLFGTTVLIERGGSPRPIKQYITNGDGYNWVKIGDAPEHGRYITRTAEKIKKSGLNKTRQVFKGDLILSNSMSFGKPYIMAIDGCIHDGWLLIRNNQNVYDLIYLCYLLGIENMLKQYKSLAGGSTVNNLNKDLVSMTTVCIPCLEEQQKIADFLSTVDEVIAQSEAEVANFEQQKKAAMQKIFSQQVRFKREDGSDYPEWEELTMREIFTEIIEKNRPDLPVLSIMQGQGTVYRANYDRNIMYDKKSTVNYKVMRKGDFIIHLRTFEGGLECATLDGISSPAYKVLRTDRLIPEAYKAYFRSIEFIDGRLAIAITGVRDGKNIEMSTFWEILVPVACLEEQQKIADFLSVYDETISYAKQELAKWKELKKGLLQQMFV